VAVRPPGTGGPGATTATVAEVTFGGERSEVTITLPTTGLPDLRVGWTGPPPSAGQLLDVTLHGPALHPLGCTG
jgi:hypothetical protein